MERRLVTKDVWAIKQPHGWQQFHVGDVVESCVEGRGGTWMAFTWHAEHFEMNIEEFQRCTESM